MLRVNIFKIPKERGQWSVDFYSDLNDYTTLMIIQVLMVLQYNESLTLFLTFYKYFLMNSILLISLKNLFKQ